MTKTSNPVDKELRTLRDFIAVQKVDLKDPGTGLVQIVRFHETLCTGIVCQTGTGVLTANGQSHPLEVSVGDTIVYDQRNAREVTTRNGNKYFIVNELSVLCVLP